MCGLPFLESASAVEPQFSLKVAVDDDVLRQAQRGLFFGKPRYGIFMTLNYKPGVKPDAVKDQVLAAVKKVLQFALSLERKEDQGERV